MTYKTLIYGLLLLCLIAGIFTSYSVRRSYLQLNLLRFDPLEERIISPDLLKVPNNENAVWLIGDSRIARWDEDLLSPLNVGIINLGIEGQTTAQILNRLRNYFEISSPQWLILEAGINDLKIIGIKKEYESMVVKGCIHNIISIIELCHEKNIKVILINILATGRIELPRRFVWNSSIDSSIIHVNTELRHYCDVNDIYFFNTDSLLCNNNSVIRKQYQNGFLHINREAYVELSNNFIKGFGSIINEGHKNKIN